MPELILRPKVAEVTRRVAFASHDESEIKLVVEYKPGALTFTLGEQSITLGYDDLGGTRELALMCCELAGLHSHG